MIEITSLAFECFTSIKYETEVQKPEELNYGSHLVRC